jgi:hypothetical protein
LESKFDNKTLERIERVEHCIAAKDSEIIKTIKKLLTV